jgi:hypothetical protein
MTYGTNYALVSSCDYTRLLRALLFRQGWDTFRFLVTSSFLQ